jgi:hypothetical protein
MILYLFNIVFFYDFIFNSFNISILKTIARFKKIKGNNLLVKWLSY